MLFLNSVLSLFMLSTLQQGHASESEVRCDTLKVLQSNKWQCTTTVPECSQDYKPTDCGVRFVHLPSCTGCTEQGTHTTAGAPDSQGVKTLPGTQECAAGYSFGLDNSGTCYLTPDRPVLCTDCKERMS